MTQVIIDDIIPRTQLVVATAGQTVFNTNWTADVESDVLVYARADGVEPDDITQLVSSVDYTVTFVGASETVRVTFLSGRTLDDVITIVRDTPADRQNLYINTNFTPSMLNEDFGILTLVDQQAQMYDQVVNPGYNVSATIDLPIDTVLPILAANQIWAMNSTRTAIIPYDVPAGGGVAPADATYLIQTANSDLPNAQIMGNLASGLVVNTTETGVQLTRTLMPVTNQTTITNGTGIGGNPTIGIADNAKLPGIEGLGIPIGTTAQRPGVPIGTELRFNSSLIMLEYWDGSNWAQLSESDGVITIEGTENQVFANGTFGTPQDGAVLLTLPQDIATTSSPEFAGVTAGNINITGNTFSSIDADGPIILQPNGNGIVELLSDLSVLDNKGILDDAGNPLLLFVKSALSDAWIEIHNGAGGDAGAIVGNSTGALAGITFQAKGNSAYGFRGTPLVPAEIQLWEQTTNGTDRIAIRAPADVTTTYGLTLPPAAPSINGQVLTALTTGVMSWSGTAIAATNGISFAGGASTLNYYDSKIAFLPGITFLTPGDLSVVFTTQTGTYIRIGDFCIVSAIVSFTPTYTTASGAISVTNMPFTPSTTSYGLWIPETSNIAYPASRTSIASRIASGASTVGIVGYGASAAITSLGTGQFLSGVAYSFRIFIWYYI